MSAERELLRRLRAALGEAELDVEALVGEAWDEARREVRDTLRRLMVRDLLERSLRAVGPAAAPPDRARSRAVEAQVSADPGAGVDPAPDDDPVAEVDPVAAVDPVGDVDPAPAATVTYLYGITRSGGSLPGGLPRLPGGGPVRTVDLGRLRALVCRLEQRTLDALQAPGSDGLDTLAAAAQGHDATLAAVAREGTVLPLRLGTVVTDESSVRALLERHADALGVELDRFDGYAEWAVTVHLRERVSPDEPAETAGTSGRDYLHLRQAALRSTQRRRDTVSRLAEEIHNRLAACAQEADVVASTPLHDVAPPLLHGVYLLDRDQRERFGAVVDELRAAHPDARVDVSGPWPPYHFTTVRIGDVGTGL
ncbi:MAG: GvpL/GvpF family gas vesicle protein [Actinomycetota bacterium]|nr:GvpL/GvpF family gas vesicle protein [Actinomycetota bacterium]